MEDGGQSRALQVRRPWLKSHCVVQRLCDLRQAQKTRTAVEWSFHVCHWSSDTMWLRGHY